MGRKNHERLVRYASHSEDARAREGRRSEMYASWRRVRSALSAASPEELRIEGVISVEVRKSQSDICCCSYASVGSVPVPVVVEEDACCC